MITKILALFKQFTWFIDLADKKPLLFVVALLLIFAGLLGATVRYQEKKRMECEFSRIETEKYFNKKLDSLGGAYREKEHNLNLEVREILQYMITDYQNQLQEQKSINKSVDSLLDKNSKLINKNRDKLKILQQ